jgi:arginyl-tRNA synthetase
VKAELKALIDRALDQLGAPDVRAYSIENTKAREHGDYASNVAMVLSKALGQKPRALAEQLLASLERPSWLTRIEIAGPGFLNFFIAQEAHSAVVAEVLAAGAGYGLATAASLGRVQVEFVSANPTGPLHVGHGRGAAFGSSLASVLSAAGYSVQREYYINDAGRQMDILALSVWLRYLQSFGEEVVVPKGTYVGEYIKHDCAQPLRAQFGERFRRAGTDFNRGLPAVPDAGDEKAVDSYVDALVARAKSLLSEDYAAVFQFGMQIILDDIKNDLHEFRVDYDSWFSERSLTQDGFVERAIERLKARGHLYQEDGALKFRATSFGDDKDRVVVRSNGVTTYFASDLGYLLSKFERGFERCIYIFGADHHGYVPRLRAAAMGLGLDAECIEIPLVQFAVLYRAGEQVKMSTRAGEFETLRRLRDEVGVDACRYFYVMRSNDQHLDFDLDLALSRAKENPVYYAQYAHARIARLLERAAERGVAKPQQADLSVLTLPLETDLMLLLRRWPETIRNAAQHRAPHLVPNYIKELAQALHGYYDAEPRIEILGSEQPLRDARLLLCLATQQVLKNALKLIGVQAPESM